MSYKTFRIWQGITAFIIAAAVAVSVSFDNWITAFAIIIAGLAVLIIIRSRVKGIVADERTYTIAGKASRLTLNIAIIGTALAGVILLVVGRGKSDILMDVGFGLEYGACALMIINALAYNYYSRKMGGKE